MHCIGSTPLSACLSEGEASSVVDKVGIKIRSVYKVLGLLIESFLVHMKQMKIYS